jgi:trimeric autotransporter adhesin
MKHVKFHLPSFLRRVRIHGGEFDSSARAMNREEQVRLLQAEPRIVRGSTIERKQMSTKTTFKRIALVAVAALGFGVLSVVPSQADVTGLEVTATNGNASVLNSDSSTAASLNIKFLALSGAADSVTVSIVTAAALPTGADIGSAGLFFTESTTSSANLPTIDTAAAGAAFSSAAQVARRAAITPGSSFRVHAPADANGTFSVKVKYSLGETSTAVGSDTITAGTYSFNAIVTSRQAGVNVTQVVPFNIVVAAAPVAATPVPAAANAKAYIQAVSTYPSVAVFADSATSGALTAGTVIGTIRVSNFTTADAAASDTITVSMTGVGYLKTLSPSTVVTGRSFVVIDEDVLTMEVIADGSSGTGTITITTAAGASFVKTATFTDTKPASATAVVAKAYIKAGTTAVDDVFAITVKDAAGNAITNANAVVTAAPTDTATTVGGAATCAWNVKGAAYHCSVKGLSTTKFGPVAYTITATGTDTAKTAVKTTATVTFADNVATKAVLAGPATATPGASVDYTITLTEKNGYPVADQTYGVNPVGGVLFAKAVTSGWTTAPFSTADSFTSKSGVLTSAGVVGIAGTATGTWTLAGDGLQTLTTDAIDKVIGKTTLTVTTEITNPGVDAATDAANEATDAANAATDAALAAAEAADAATTAAQEASDAVAALSASVTKLIEGLQAQIKSLAAVVAKIAKKVKA